MTVAAIDNPTAVPAGGPRTDEGKEKSRRNALKNGLRSKVVFPEDLEKIIADIHRDFRAEFQPGSSYEDTLILHMAIAAAKIERCSSCIVTEMTNAAQRAVDHWDSDRMSAIGKLALKLPKQPSRIARELLRSKQGTEWLIQNWLQLKSGAEENGCWDEEQRSLAFDLLGISHVHRKHTRNVPRGDETQRILALVEEKLEELASRYDELESLDESEREMAMMGMPLHEDPETTKIRREENRARRDFNNARDALFKYRNTGIAPSPQTRPETDRAPLSKAAADNLVKRSDMPREFVHVEVEAEPEPAPVAAPAPTPAAARAPFPVPGVSQKRPNRLARKQQARRDREVAKAAAKR